MTRLPYYVEHAAIALFIQFSIYAATHNELAGLCAGISFYAGREIRDLEKLGFIDWKGICFPVAACLIAWSLL